MSPITHFLAGWCIAHTLPNRFSHPRDRIAIALAGVAPDLDGLGILADWATKNSTQPSHWWSEYHHVLGHNLAFALIVSTLCTLCTLISPSPSRHRPLVFLLAAASFHAHLLGDILGSRGPEGESWPIFYFYPLSNSAWGNWTGQWPLNGWQNFVITGSLLLTSLRLAWARGHSVFEAWAPPWDQALVHTLRKRWGQPHSATASIDCRR